MLRENGAAGFGLSAWAGCDLGSERFHKGATIRLLVVAYPHHVNLAVEAEERASHGQRRSPLSCAGLGGEMLGAVHLVVVDLRHGGVELMRAGGACAFVLVVNVRGRIEGLLKPAGAEQWATAATERRSAALLQESQSRARC